MMIQAHRYKDIEIGQVFAEGFDKNGAIYYEKISGNKAKVCKVEGTYGSWYIGATKIFYGMNKVFINTNT